ARFPLGSGINGNTRSSIALGHNCIVDVAVANNCIIGYIRCRKDGIFGLYVYDLLVSKQWREKGRGKRLIETAAAEQPRTWEHFLDVWEN
ncbi:hypothetical protein CEP14_13255, partial [Cylindrospermopsis raciborskii C04]